MRRDERPVLAMIPRGTGMDFVRTYGIPSRFEAAVRVAAGDGVRTIDVGRVEHAHGVRWFANVASVGMSAAVARRANGMSKALGGRATFFYALTRVFLECTTSSSRTDAGTAAPCSSPRTPSRTTGSSTSS
jgi:diacylglycerol kinase family enzyme